MIRLPKTFSMFDDEVVLYIDKYSVGGRLEMAIIAQSTKGEPYGVLSVNIPEESAVGDYEFLAKNYSENEELYRLALDTKMFDVVGFIKGFPLLKLKEEYRHLVPKE